MKKDKCITTYCTSTKKKKNKPCCYFQTKNHNDYHKRFSAYRHKHRAGYNNQRRTYNQRRELAMSNYIQKRRKFSKVLLLAYFQYGVNIIGIPIFYKLYRQPKYFIGLSVQQDGNRFISYVKKR